MKATIPVIINVYINKEKNIYHIEFIKIGKKSNFKHQNRDEISSLKCNNIIEFCELFPFLSYLNELDILEFEERIKLKEALNEYFNIINEYVKEENIFKEYKELNEQNRIIIQIEDFIHAQLYDKIFSGLAVPSDIEIFKKCVTLKWVKPTMINEELIYLDEEMTQMMKIIIRNIEEEISPNNKLKEFEKLDLIINNMITLYGYSKDVYLSVMVYAFIQGQTYRINSSYKYIKMYFSKLLKNGDELLKKFDMMLKKITDFSEKDLVGITKEVYDNNIKNVIISMSS